MTISVWVLSSNGMVTDPHPAEGAWRPSRRVGTRAAPAPSPFATRARSAYRRVFACAPRGESSHSSFAACFSSQRLRGIEIGTRNADAARAQFGEEAWPHAGRDEMSFDAAVGRGPGAHIFVDLLHL